MQPGVYIILGGGFSVSGGGSVNGTGVMIYNAVGSDDDGNDGDNDRNDLQDDGHDLGDGGGGDGAGSIDVSGDGHINLTAPATGPYAGILIFQARDDTRDLRLSGGALSGMSGTIYAAAAPASLSGDVALKVPFVVNTLTLGGNAVLGDANSLHDDDDQDDGDDGDSQSATDGFRWGWSYWQHRRFASPLGPLGSGPGRGGWCDWQNRRFASRHGRCPPPPREQ